MSHSCEPSRIIFLWLAIFRSRCRVDPRLFGQQRLQFLARLLPDGVAILQKTHCLNFRQRVRHRVRQLVQFVPADSHRTALYLRVSSPFTLLNISEYCAPVLRISSE